MSRWCDQHNVYWSIDTRFANSIELWNFAVDTYASPQPSSTLISERPAKNSRDCIQLTMRICPIVVYSQLHNTMPIDQAFNVPKLSYEVPPKNIIKSMHVDRRSLPKF